VAYRGTLINRLAQFDLVTYDLVIVDGANVMPTHRLQVQWPVANDTPSNNTAFVAAQVLAATTAQLPVNREAVLQGEIANLQQQQASLNAAIANLQANVAAGNY
jgi:hypothetical protein